MSYDVWRARYRTGSCVHRLCWGYCSAADLSSLVNSFHADAHQRRNWIPGQLQRTRILQELCRRDEKLFPYQPDKREILDVNVCTVDALRKVFFANVPDACRFDRGKECMQDWSTQCQSAHGSSSLRVGTVHTTRVRGPFWRVVFTGVKSVACEHSLSTRLSKMTPVSTGRVDNQSTRPVNTGGVPTLTVTYRHAGLYVKTRSTWATFSNVKQVTSKTTIRYDTIRYSRFTCAQKLTRWPA